MATRFYPTSDVDPAAGAASHSIWDEESTNLGFSLMTPVKRGTSMASTSAAETSITNNWDVLLWEFVSAPLAAQTITGTLKVQMQCLESSSGANFVSQLAVQVVTPVGGVRGVLYAGDTSAVHTSEWPTARTNRTFPRAALVPVSLSSVAVTRGDAIQIEVGYEAHNTGGSSVSGTIWFGDDQATDLPEDETDTATTKSPWFEFSQDLIFAGSPVWGRKLKARTGQGALVQL